MTLLLKAADDAGFDVAYLFRHNMTMHAIGTITTEECLAHSITGPILRSTGFAWDLRKAQPYLAYDDVDFDVIYTDNGDVFDRYQIRLYEILESVKIVRQCVEVGLVQGTHLSVDGSFIEANAAKESRIPREQLAEAAQVHHSVRQYLREVEEQNPVEEPVHEQDQVSTTDPDSTYATKGGTPARLGYYDNYLVDNHSCVIVGVQATAARMSQETVAAQDMIARFAEWQGRNPESVVADATYGNGEFLQWLMERGITPYMRTRDSTLRKNNPLYGPERFTYLPENNSYLCPAGEQLNYVGLNVRNRAHAYIGSGKRCGACSQKAQCTSGRYKYLAIHMHEPARQRARDLANTPAFATAQRKRKKVEALFAELKNLIGLRRLRLRRMKFVREQFFLAAAAQNLKRLVRFLSQPTAPTGEATT